LDKKLWLDTSSPGLLQTHLYLANPAPHGQMKKDAREHQKMLAATGCRKVDIKRILEFNEK
jgi:hypothetical protein